MIKKIKTDDFIKKAKNIHGNKYDYSLVEYINNRTKVKIICSNHGIFQQSPDAHLHGKGCITCSGRKRLTKEEFIKNAIQKHGERYDYSLVEYINNKKKVKIICLDHGMFELVAKSHVNGQGCSKCADIQRIKSKLFTNEKFINKAKNIHGNRYDYSEVNYVGTYIKVKIICPDHGIFEQVPNTHLTGHGCPKCSGRYQYNTKDFIEKAIETHSNKYDYSLVNYINSYIKVKIICKKHGVFEQSPNNHLNGSGCKFCKYEKLSKLKKSNLNQYIKKARKTHGNKYDYSLVIYNGNKTKIKIICKEHGIFEQTPNNHLKGQGCQKCCGNYQMLKKEFIEKAKNVHGDKYDYSLVEYVNNKTKIKIICSDHGVFEQSPNAHLNGQSCSKCAGKYHYTTEEFVEKAIKIHGERYDYSSVNYVNINTKVKIKCKEHGIFKQLPSKHLLLQGCSKCVSSIGENKIRKVLIEYKIKFEEQFKVKFKNRKLPLYFDFYLPDYNSVIEYHGKQHFISVDFFGGEDSFKKNYERDVIKYEFCKEKNINYLLFTEKDLDFLDNKLIDDIKNNNVSLIYENEDLFNMFKETIY